MPFKSEPDELLTSSTWQKVHILLGFLMMLSKLIFWEMVDLRNLKDSTAEEKWVKLWRISLTVPVICRVFRAFISRLLWPQLKGGYLLFLCRHVAVVDEGYARCVEFNVAVEGEEHTSLRVAVLDGILLSLTRCLLSGSFFLLHVFACRAREVIKKQPSYIDNRNLYESVIYSS